MEYSNNCNVSSEQNNNTIYVSGGSDTRLAIDVANNKSRYYAELAEGYKNEAKTFRDSAKAYAEQNSDVSKTYVDDIAAGLRTLIGTKQDSGNYALASEIPTKVSDLQNDSNFLTTVPTATTTVLGVVKPDGETIVIDDGIISAEFPTRNIGEIVASTIPLTDAGLHLLDGALISGSGSYSDFVAHIAGLYADSSYSAIFDTEANWQAAVTANGVCGKFVYDSVNNTVRLPKYSNKIYTSSISSNAPVKGNGMALGFTDGNDNAGLYHRNMAYLNGSAAFQLRKDSYGSSIGTTVSSDDTTWGSTMITTGVTTDGSKSGIIADLSNITTSLDGYYYIVVATSTKTDIQVDIDEITTDLNGKADVDLSNANPSGSFGSVLNTAGIRTVVYQTTSNGCEIRVWSDGFKEIFCKQITNASAAAVDISYPTNGGTYAFTAVPTLIVNQYSAATATTGQAYRTTGYARSATGFSVYFAAANASISYYACGY